MRQVQVGMLVLAWAALLAALFFIGEDLGLTLWRTGIALLLSDIVFMMLWPTSPKGVRASSEP
jgi:hypothetical protein